MLRRQYLYGVAALLVLPVAAANADEQTWFPSEPPSSANPGECYARVRIEPQYEPFTESVVTGDSYESYDVRPPVLDQTVTEYMSREAGMRYVVREPIYETVVERVQVRPAYVEYVVEPAVHDQVTEQVMVREPRLVWQAGRVPGAQMTRYDPETGEVWCLIEEPGEYRTVTRNVVVSPARISEVEVPAEYANISREVLVQEASVEQIPIPAEYDSYSQVVLTQPARVESHVVEGRTESITRYRLVSQERYEWRVMDCDEIELPAYDRPAVRQNNAPMTYERQNETEFTTPEWNGGTPVSSVATSRITAPAEIRASNVAYRN